MLFKCKRQQLWYIITPRVNTALLQKFFFIILALLQELFSQTIYYKQLINPFFPTPHSSVVNFFVHSSNSLILSLPPFHRHISHAHSSLQKHPLCHYSHIPNHYSHIHKHKTKSKNTHVAIVSSALYTITHDIHTL